ncbi:RC-LH1 core complex protein PufX [Cypionkella sinensis]|uniref:RC-LH1 core complex protein PufX n=1 Tax=Cypionkella sinensis TaxID=1756043 RepID=A0ABV7J1A5_9RHOB
MSDEYLYEGQSRVVRLRVWALGQMVWGAFMAGIGVAIVGAILLAIWGVSMLLPEQSKQAPSPYGALEISQPAARIV